MVDREAIDRVRQLAFGETVPPAGDRGSRVDLVRRELRSVGSVWLPDGVRHPGGPASHGVEWEARTPPGRAL